MFSENDRRNVLLASITIFVMIFACAGSIRLYKLAVPEQVDRDTVSYSRADLEQALARWQATGVRSYEITVRSDDDLVVLRVSNLGRSIDVLQHLHRDRPIDELRMSPDSAKLRTMTVEHLFEMAWDPLLIGAPAGASRPSEDRNVYTYFYDFNMRFDEQLGYPTYMSQYERFTGASHEITWRKSIWPPIEVKALKVLESR